MLDFTCYPDLAARSLAGSVISANDELFAPRQNLIMPACCACRGRLRAHWQGL